MSVTNGDTGEQLRRTAASLLENSGISIDRLPGLPALLDRFAVEMGETLRILFGSAPLTTFEDMEATTSFEALARWEGRAAVLAKAQTIEAHVLIALDSGIVDFLLASAFKVASGDALPDNGVAPARRPQTDTERRLLAEFGTAVVRSLGTAFSASGMEALEFENVLILLDTFALGRRDLPIGAFRFAIETTAGQAELCVLVPQSLLKLLRDKPVAAAPSPATTDGDWTRDFGLGVTKARLPITAVLEEFETSLGEVAKFHIGQILELRGAGLGRVRVDCAGRRVYFSRLLQRDDRYCLEIEGEIEEE